MQARIRHQQHQLEDAMSEVSHALEVYEKLGAVDRGLLERIRG